MTRHNGWIGTLLSLPLVLAACAQQAPPPPPPPAVAAAPAVVPLSPADAAFANTAAQSGMFALQSSQVAAERSSRQSIQTFAQSVVAQETKAAGTLASIAQAHGFALPQFLTAEQRRTVDEMGTASPGAPLARIYFIGFVRDRMAMLRAARNFANEGTDPALKAFAAEQVPVLQDQLAQARRVPRQRGG